MLGFLSSLMDWKSLVVAGLVAAAGTGVVWFVDDYFDKAHKLRQAEVVIETERRTNRAQNEELDKLVTKARERSKVIRDALSEIAKVKVTCGDSAAGRAALERLRELFGGQTPADNQ